MPIEKHIQELILYTFMLCKDNRGSSLLTPLSLSVLPLSFLILSIPSYHCTKSPQFLW